MVKPDGVQRGLVGDIISRFERKGFKLVALKLYQTPKEVAEEHYKDLSARPFYNDLVKYIVSGPVVSMVSLWLLHQQPQQRKQCCTECALCSDPAAAAGFQSPSSRT
jgi:nucleoside diphosphate kinase